jgi:hypothetical protein
LLAQWWRSTSLIGESHVACLAIVVPLTLVNRIYNKHVIRYQKDLHDRFESLYDVFETKDIEFIRSYFQSTARAHQKIANWGAVNFSAMRLVLLGSVSDGALHLNRPQ